MKYIIVDSTYFTHGKNYIIENKKNKNKKNGL